MDPELPDPAVPPPLLQNRKLLVLIGGAVLMLALFTATYFVFGSFRNAPNANPTATPTFKNQLSPSAEIKVGDFRYVSPCQALPLKTVVNIFKTVNGDSSISETSLPLSVPNTGNQQPVRTSCEYLLSNGGVTLSAEQYTSINDLSNPAHVLFVKASDIQSSIDALKKTVGSSNNADAAVFIRDMQAGLLVFNNAASSNSLGDVPQVSLNGIIAPSQVNTYTFNFIYGNVVYNLALYPPKLLSPTPPTIVQIGQLHRAIQAVLQNVKNKRLDQSPAPIFLGNSNKIGSTKGLESCVILDADAFRTITGLAQNSILQRVTLPIDIAKLRHDTTGHIAPPGNQCVRNYQNNNNGSASNVSAELDLYQSRTVSQSQQLVAEYKVGALANSITPVQTNADEAFVSDTPDSISPTYIFRVGPYVGDLTLTSSTTANLSDGFHDQRFSQAQYVQAIDILVANLKQQLK